MVPYANKIVWLKDVYKDTKKILGGRDGNIQRIWEGGRHPPLEYLPVLKKNGSQTSFEHWQVYPKSF